jgi:hypothetical protein
VIRHPQTETARNISAHQTCGPQSIFDNLLDLGIDSGKQRRPRRKSPGSDQLKRPLGLLARSCSVKTTPKPDCAARFV